MLDLLMSLSPWLSGIALAIVVLITLATNIMPAFQSLRTILAFSGMMLFFGGMQVL